MRILTLFIFVLVLIMSCAAPPRTVKQTEETKQIDVYHTQQPDRSYTELSTVVVSFRERGFLTGSGSEELMIEKLKEKAVEYKADAIMNINITIQPIQGEMNKHWSATAVAIKYKE
jgi:hypothetical protein